jgi:hypothetical protein
LSLVAAGGIDTAEFQLAGKTALATEASARIGEVIATVQGG